MILHLLKDTFVPECLEYTFLSSIQDLLKLKYSTWLLNQDSIKIRQLSRQNNKCLFLSKSAWKGNLLHRKKNQKTPNFGERKIAFGNWLEQNMSKVNMVEFQDNETTTVCHKFLKPTECITLNELYRNTWTLRDSTAAWVPCNNCSCGTGGHSENESWMKEQGLTQRCTEIRDTLWTTNFEYCWFRGFFSSFSVSYRVNRNYSLHMVLE